MRLFRTQARVFTAADALLELLPPSGIDVIPVEVLAADPVYVYAGTGKVFTRPELIRALRFLMRLGVIPTPPPPLTPPLTPPEPAQTVDPGEERDNSFHPDHRTNRFAH